MSVAVRQARWSNRYSKRSRRIVSMSAALSMRIVGMLGSVSSRCWAFAPRPARRDWISGVIVLGRGVGGGLAAGGAAGTPAGAGGVAPAAGAGLAGVGGDVGAGGSI